MPVVNRALRSLMITEPSRPGVMRYAGALLTDSTGAACSAIVGLGGQAAPTGLTVGIPLVESRDAAGRRGDQAGAGRRGDSRGRRTRTVRREDRSAWSTSRTRTAADRSTRIR